MSTGGSKSYEPSLGHFNTAAIERIDYAIASAKRHGVRLIIPLTDNWPYYHGGKWDFVNWEGKSPDNKCARGNVGGTCCSPSTPTSKKCPFYTDNSTIVAFRHYVSALLNHTNQYTLTRLADEEAILAWETGNELVGSNPQWTTSLGEFIKKDLGAKQLVMDGRDEIREGSDPAFLAIPSVDMITDHYYGSLENGQTSFVSSDAAAAAKAGKVYTVGEYGWEKNGLRDFLEEVENNTAVSGDLYWSFFPHADGGGFVSHGDGHTLHYPGDGTRMRKAAALLRGHAFRMQGVPVPPHSLPSAPVLLSAAGGCVRWQGAVAAAAYTVERQEGGTSGKWVVICDKCAADSPTGWLDTTYSGQATTYRATAVNLDGKLGKASAPMAARGAPSTKCAPPTPTPAPRPPTPQPPAAKCAFQQSEDCSGGSGPAGEKPAASQQVCCEICAAADHCGSAIYQAPSGKCFLKPSDCTPVQKQGVSRCVPTKVKSALQFE